MTLLQSIEEAKVLKDYIDNVYKEIHHITKFNESEVQLRAETLRGFVAILSSDVFEILKQWNEEIDRKVDHA